jgi:HAD superfamily hydrolase (TIGR01509 family)
LEFCRRHRDEIVAVDENFLRARVFGVPNRDWIPAVFREKPESTRVGELAEEKETIFRDLIRGSITPLPGLLGLLDDLTALGIPLAVASSAPAANIEMVLGEGRLAGYFSAVLNADSVPGGKPAGDIYLKAAEALTIAPERCVVFEDSIAGIEAGRRAGCTVIGVTTTHPRTELASLADLVIVDFREATVAALISILDRRHVG